MLLPMFSIKSSVAMNILLTLLKENVIPLCKVYLCYHSSTERDILLNKLMKLSKFKTFKISPIVIPKLNWFLPSVLIS